MAMTFCSHCGREALKKDVFCRQCGTKIAKSTSKGSSISGVKGQVTELKELVEKAAKEIKKELLTQISEIEEKLDSGKITREQFDKEADEIRNRLMVFIKK